MHAKEGICIVLLFPKEELIKTSAYSASIFIYEIVSFCLSHEICLQCIFAAESDSWSRA